MKQAPEAYFEGNVEEEYGKRLRLVILCVCVALVTFGLLLWNSLRYGKLEGLTFMLEASPTKAPSPTRPKDIAPTPLPSPLVAFSATGSKVTITGIQRDGEVESVTITNQGGATQDMAGRALCRAPCEGRFLFPHGFLLEPNVSVQVYSGKLRSQALAWGFHWTEENLWGRTHGEALLLDAAGRVVSRYRY